MYVIEHEGKLDDTLERMLDEHIERPFALVRNMVLYGRSVGLTGRLSDEDKAAVATFVAIQYVRTPKFREQHNLLAEFTGNFVMRAELQNLAKVQADLEHLRGELVSLEELQEMQRELESGELRIEVNEKLWLGESLQQAFDMVPQILELPWRICWTPPGLSVPTSDTPVVLVRRTSETTFLHGGAGQSETLR